MNILAPYGTIEDFLTSAIYRMRCSFRDLQVDCIHALNYDPRVFLVEHEVQCVEEWLKKYSEAIEVCHLYLNTDISLECLLYELLKLDLQSYINQLDHFLPQDLRDRFVRDSSCDSEQ